jgi:CxxC motif-containing protein (DUF1111 family)
MKPLVKRVSPLLITITVALALSSIVAMSGGRQTSNTPTTATSGGITPVFGGQRASDPGARTDSAGAGGAVAPLTPEESEYFQDGLARFNEVDSVSGTAPKEVGKGLGPTFNSNSCGNCHAQPAAGGSSPSINPQVALATDYGANNSVPNFIKLHGPVREVRFPFLLNSNGTLSTSRDGGVHALYTIAGRADAPNCTMPQPNFAQMEQLGNVIFRIPTPVFGAGLIENIPEATIVSNMNANSGLKQLLGISGHPNTSGNDGTITRFGWKAQNKSIEIFAGEAYNVEMGVTNELFTNERAQPPASCMTNPTPEDSTNFPASGAASSSDVSGFSHFMRFLAPPAPSTLGIPGNPSTQSIANGKMLFSQVHCDACHTASLQTGTSSLTSALSNQTVPLYSDLLVHNMGSGLADNIVQGGAGPDEFRTAPLWGLGQRLFFLHDGRATPFNGGLLTAIQAHSSSGSEANAVVGIFNLLTESQKQDLLNFLRSL